MRIGLVLTTPSLRRLYMGLWPPFTCQNPLTGDFSRVLRRVAYRVGGIA